MIDVAIRTTQNGGKAQGMPAAAGLADMVDSLTVGKRAHCSDFVPDAETESPYSGGRRQR